jgi:hypothetical protein
MGGSVGMKHHYVIFYVGDVVGNYGMIEFIRNAPITLFSELKEIAQLIVENTEYSRVMITNYILLRVENENGTERANEESE